MTGAGGAAEPHASESLQKVGGGGRALTAAQRLKALKKGGADAGGAAGGAGPLAAASDGATPAIDPGDQPQKVGGGGRALSAAQKLKKLSGRFSNA